MTYSVGYPHFLGVYGVVQDPLVVITFTVGSYLEDSLTAHLSFREEALLVAFLSASQSSRGCNLS